MQKGTTGKKREANVGTVLVGNGSEKETLMIEWHGSVASFSNNIESWSEKHNKKLTQTWKFIRRV